MPDHSRIAPRLKSFDSKKFLIEELGWDHTMAADFKVAVDSMNYRLTPGTGRLCVRSMECERAGWRLNS